MFQPKFVKFVILPILLLILFISPRLAAGAWLEPEDNIAVKCDFFIESIAISNRPGEVRVSFIVHNISAEDPTRQLKLTIASFSENHNEINLIAQDLSYENGILVEYIKTNPSKFDDLQLYRHEFRLIFDPPISEGKRTMTILYNTNGSNWENDLINMHLYVYIWSPKIVLQENAYVYVDGEGEGFKFKRINQPWENWTYYNNNRGLRVVINPAALISNPYVRYIDALYTPGYPSQWYMWDQYQKIEDALRDVNELLERAEDLLSQSYNNLILATASVILAILAIALSYYTVRKLKYHGDKLSEVKKLKDKTKNRYARVLEELKSSREDIKKQSKISMIRDAGMAILTIGGIIVAISLSLQIALGKEIQDLAKFIEIGFLFIFSGALFVSAGFGDLPSREFWRAPLKREHGGELLLLSLFIIAIISLILGVVRFLFL